MTAAWPGASVGAHRAAHRAAHLGMHLGMHLGARQAGRRWLTALAALALSAVLALLQGCATVVPVPRAESAAPETAAGAQAAWARVLDRFVNPQGEVDFLALSQDRGDLDRMLRHVAATPLDSLDSGPPRLAHMINAYNALSMFNVIDSGFPASHAGLNKVVFFVSRRFTVGGQAVSLYGFENDLIRPLGRQLGDPRLHFALNCSAVSCPVLPRKLFTAANLNQELDRETRAFFARPENLRVDDASRTIFFNEILSFYTEDFVPRHAPTLIDYVARYGNRELPRDYTIAFTPYDWTVANQRRKR